MSSKRRKKADRQQRRKRKDERREASADPAGTGPEETAPSVPDDRPADISEVTDPELREELQDLDARRREGEDVSPQMHLEIHNVVENQVAADDPPGIRSFFDRTVAAAGSRHEAVHLVGLAVSDEMYQMMTGSADFDPDRYFRRLEELYAALKEHGPGRWIPGSADA